MTVAEPAVAAESELILWGGAVSAVLPTRFRDLSDVRPVPDHQEVWHDPELDQALGLEIVEHQGDLPDAQLAAVVWDDNARGNEAAAAQLEGVARLDPAALPCLPSDRLAAALLLTGTQTLQRGRTDTPSRVLLAVLRLPGVGSDLLVSLSTPQGGAAGARGGGDGAAEAGAAAQDAVMRRVLGSLRVHDWGLFGG